MVTGAGTTLEELKSVVVVKAFFFEETLTLFKYILLQITFEESM